MQDLIGAVAQLSPKERKALAILLKQKGINLFGVAPIFKRSADEPQLLSYAQERLWFLWQLEPQSTAYHIPMVLKLSGTLDLPALQASFDALVARHEALRTRFAQDGEQVVQVIAAAAPLSIERQALPAGIAEQALLEQVEAEIQRPFDLEQGNLLRVKLFSLGSDEQVLVLTQHHIVSDGWSMQVMVDELLALYAGAVAGRPVELPPLAIQYPDYALWQRQWMEAGERERQLAYWRTQLAGEQPVLSLPHDRLRPQQQSYRGATLDLQLPDGLAAQLAGLALRQGVTLFTLLLAAFQVLLQRHSGQADIRVGVPIANRKRSETEALIGFFVNTQILRAEVDGQQPFAAFLQQLKHTVLQAQEHQDLPFEQLVDALQPERNLSHNPLFQVLFNHQSESAQVLAPTLAGLRVDTLALGNATAQFDLTLNTVQCEDQLAASLTYATDLFDASTVERLAAHWLNLLQAVVANPEQRIAELPMQAPAEQAASLAEWNADSRDFPAQACLHQLIEAQAA
ncbi:condensation domain-containing protein, partial [Pseudomonas sp. ES1]